ncbi:MAG: M56 family metallopeptidase [Chitinophagia bacterium]|nr:M56 family metallopeptidase [Chitinophagia bacterium]NDD15569.1 M56 family metallopeptidase [Chitinophagia bacterium]
MHFLINIPIAIVNNIGFLAILFMVYQVTKSLQEKEILNLQAAYLFNMACIFQCLGLVQFILVLFYPALSIELVSQKLNSLNTSISSLFVQSPIHWLSFIAWLYCIILIALIFKSVFQFYQLTVLIKSSNFSNTDNYTSFINTLPKPSLGRKVKLGFSSTIESPISFGWIEPIILLPIAIVNQLSVKEIQSIIIHEWAHILRNDYLVNLLTSFVQLVLFFNPFTYLFNKEISLQREIACDSFVINASVGKLDYLNTLYKMATGLREKEIAILNTSKWTMGILNMPNELLYRVKFLTKTKRFNFIHSTRVILTSLLVSLLFLFPFDQNQNKQILKNQPKVLFTSKLLISGGVIKKTTPFKSTHLYTSIHKHSHLLQKRNHENTAMLNLNDESRSNELINKSYNEMVEKTMKWIKTREVMNQFANYEESLEDIEFEVAERLLMRAIFTNYQLKRELLNERLTKATYEKEAMDYLVNSKEWEQMQQFEKWTAEFLKKHPQNIDTTTNFSTLKDRLIVY